MKLRSYELQVIKLMLKNKLGDDNWTLFLKEHELIDFEYTGAGYFLKIRTANLNLPKETINKPTITGENEDLMIGFLLFVDKNEIVLECHSWGGMNPLENVRELDVEVKMKSQNF